MIVSICIVTLNARILLKKCIDSIPIAMDELNYEIIIVDNNSADGTIEMLQTFYPEIILIRNLKNDGYTKPMNQALEKAQGDYLLQLNPDTILSHESVSLLFQYMEANPKVGICEPRIIGDNGLFQYSSRRGIATPWATITYFLGLSTIFSNDPRFTQYRLEHLDENIISEVDGVSGTCMFFRRSVLKEVGYLDERFFAYQEDSDYCLRAKTKGWKIIYNPITTIYHSRGHGGSGTQPMKSIFEWHRSYYHFYKKHLAKNYFFLFNWIYILMMVGKLIFTEIKHILRT
tara:strand:+ start:189 stop:1052 length:864 start_codon:yes stop_codon:yes gene_type:complete